MNPSLFFSLLKEAFTEWNKDKASVWSASLAYYTVFSIGPLLLVIISILGILVSTSDVEKTITGQLSDLVGARGASFFESVARQSQSKSSGIIGTIIGVITLILGATGVFGQMKQMLNYIWGVKTKPRAGIWGLIRDRLLNFAMLGAILFIILASLLASTAITSLGTYVSDLLPLSPWILEIINFLLSLAILTLLFQFIFKILPDALIKWDHVLPGAILTAVLFTIGKTILGYYIGTSGAVSAYGAAGSLIILLLWVYYAGQILFFGAEFAKAYTLRKVGRITPGKYGAFDEDQAIKIQNLTDEKKPSGLNKFVSSFVSGFLKASSQPISHKNKNES